MSGDREIARTAPRVLAARIDRFVRSPRHENLPGLGQHLEDVIDGSWKIVVNGDGGVVAPKRCAAQISLVDGREQERRVGKEQLSVLVRE